jgi:hypothetical protein
MHPAGAWCTGSVHRDDDLAERVTLTDVGERVGDVIEPERAVDMDANVPSDAQVGQWPEAGGSFLYGEHSQLPTSEPAGEPANRQHAQQHAHRPADTPLTAAASECSAVGEHRSMSDEVEDEVVVLASSGEVLTAIVDDRVGTE